MTRAEFREGARIRFEALVDERPDITNGDAAIAAILPMIAEAIAREQRGTLRPIPERFMDVLLWDNAHDNLARLLREFTEGTTT